MRTQLSEDVSDGRTVRFTSSAGAGAGLWRGASVEAGTVVDIECEFPKNLRWRVDIWPIDHERQTGFDSTAHAILRVEDQHDDGVLVARLGSGLVLLVTSGEMPLVVGNLVSVRASDLELYPTGI